MPPALYGASIVHIRTRGITVCSNQRRPKSGKPLYVRSRDSSCEKGLWAQKFRPLRIHIHSAFRGSALSNNPSDKCQWTEKAASSRTRQFALVALSLVVDFALSVRSHKRASWW
ncbi:hypothetical protein BDW60DRAFT_189926 [Aspergillus nidulans var. acristatus]